MRVVLPPVEVVNVMVVSVVVGTSVVVAAVWLLSVVASPPLSFWSVSDVLRELELSAFTVVDLELAGAAVVVDEFLALVVCDDIGDDVDVCDEVDGGTVEVVEEAVVNTVVDSGGAVQVRTRLISVVPESNNR